MGIDVTAALFYGVKFGESVEYEDKEQWEDVEDNLTEEWELLYLRRIGKENVPYDEYKEIIDKVGIQIYSAGSSYQPEYYFIIPETIITSSWRYGGEQIKDINMFDRVEKYAEWNKRLKDFFEVMGITGGEYGDIPNAAWYLTTHFSG